MGNELAVDHSPLSAESLVPRLGDSLLEAGIITSEQLNHALIYQKEQAANGNQRMLGQVLTDLGIIDRDTLDRAIAKQLVSLHQALTDQNRQLEIGVKQRTEELEHRIIEIRTASEITQIALNALNLDELLERTVNLIADRFQFSQVTVFLIDPEGKYAVLSEASGSMGKTLKETGFKIALASQSIVGWVASNNQTRVSADVREDPFYFAEDSLPNTMSEVAIPLALHNLQGNSQVLGVLDVQHVKSDAFDDNMVATLQTVANHIAATISNLRLLNKTQDRLYEISLLYQASLQIAQANTVTDIIGTAANSLTKSELFSTVLLPDNNHMIVYQIQKERLLVDTGQASQEILSQDDSQSPEQVEKDPEEQTDLVWPVIPTSELISRFKKNKFEICDLHQSDLPHALIAIPRHFGCTTAAFVPVITDDSLEAVFIIGSREKQLLTEEAIQPYASLAIQTSTAIEKVYALQKVEKRLSALQALNTVTQAVSIETDLQSLYRSVHNEVNQIMGDVNFIIALYDEETNFINIPYMYEEQSVKSVDPFPLGEGLTSILIRTQHPLLIVEDTETRARELGAIVLGTPAKSWMGVPLLIGGESIGAIIVQDLEEENRFDESDLNLLSTLALQVAAGLRNARLLERTYHQAERDRRLHEISKKIHSSSDMQTILKTTAEELGKYTDARRIRIELGDNTKDHESGESDLNQVAHPVPPFSSIEDSL